MRVQRGTLYLFRGERVTSFPLPLPCSLSVPSLRAFRVMRRAARAKPTAMGPGGLLLLDEIRRDNLPTQRYV